MNSTYRSVEALLACRLLTQDGAEAGLTDLILDTEAWQVQFLMAEAANWAPDGELPLPPRLVADIDESRGLISLDLTGQELQASPLLQVGEGLAGFAADGIAMPPKWREHWRVGMQPEGDIEAPEAPAQDDETAADLGVETDLSVEQLIRADTLRGLSAETADGTQLRLRDLLVDDADWTLAYLDLLLDADHGAAGSGGGKPLRCLVARDRIDWLHPSNEVLHLSVSIQDLRDAPTGPLPVAGGGETSVHIMTPKG